jgi:hypothetical protein
MEYTAPQDIVPIVLQECRGYVSEPAAMLAAALVTKVSVRASPAAGRQAVLTAQAHTQ